MKARFAIFVVALVPSLAFAQSLAGVDTMTDELATIAKISMPIGMVFFILTRIFSAEEIGTIVLFVLGIAFFPITLVVLVVRYYLRVKAKRAAQLEVVAIAEKEAATRAAFDDWLTEAVLAAEIDACADPGNSKYHERLELLRGTKRSNATRLIALDDRDQAETVKEIDVQAVISQWEKLKAA